MIEMITDAQIVVNRILNSIYEDYPEEIKEWADKHYSILLGD